MSLSVNIQKIDSIQVVKPVGRLDTITVPGFEEKVLPLTEIDGVRLLIDMNAVEYMSSAGLRILLVIHRQIENSQGQFILTDVNDNIQNVFSLTGFLDFFEIESTLESGLEKLRS